MYLLDTNVISAAAPRNKARDVAAWMDAASHLLYLSVVTAAEIMAGVAKKEREGALRRANEIRLWWANVETTYGRRILTFDLACAAEAGLITDQARAHSPGFGDIAIAATANVHGLTVLTANERHFLPLGVSVMNPFVTLPSLPPAS